MTEKRPKATPGSVRGQYVRAACETCKRRKTKCSGEQPCMACQVQSLHCSYAAGPNKRRRKSKKDHVRRQTDTELSNEATNISSRNPDSAAGPALTCPTPNEPASGARDISHSAKRQLPGVLTSPREDRDSLKAWQANVDRRLQLLEQNLRQRFNSDLMSHPLTAANADCDASSAFGSDDLSESRIYSRPAVVSSATQRFLGSSLIRLDAFAVPDRASSGSTPSAQSAQCQMESDFESFEARAGSRSTNVGSYLGIDQNTGPLIKESVQSYFTNVNSMYPFINETQCLSELEIILDQINGESLGSSNLHFAALIKMMQATVRILEELHPEQGSPPGWQEYQEAVHLTTRLTPPYRPTLAAIQFLIAKTIYETLCDMLSTAYDTLASCVRMCYQLRLNSQPSNLKLASGQNHTVTEVMCSIYCLDKDISRFLEIPCIMRDCDLKIPLTQQLSAADQHSPISASSKSGNSDQNSTHLEALVQWSVLSSEICDRVASASASKPTSPDIVAVMDDRLVILYQSLPSKFQWSRNMLAADNNASAKQALFFYLRFCDLQLLARQECMLSLPVDHRLYRTGWQTAKQMVATIDLFYRSQLFRPSDRTIVSILLTRAVIYVSLILIRCQRENMPRQEPLACFRTAHTVLCEISSSALVARETLRSLRDVIQGVNENHPANSHHDPDTQDQATEPLEFPVIALDSEDHDQHNDTDMRFMDALRTPLETDFFSGAIASQPSLSWDDLYGRILHLYKVNGKS
ncbi:hypothetical protein KCU95_g5906, partial [Aureobasidium melanogenum]